MTMMCSRRIIYIIWFSDCIIWVSLFQTISNKNFISIPQRFSDVFRGYSNGANWLNGLNCFLNHLKTTKLCWIKFSFKKFLFYNFFGYWLYPTRIFWGVRQFPPLYFIRIKLFLNLKIYMIISSHIMHHKITVTSFWKFTNL